MQKVTFFSAILRHVYSFLLTLSIPIILLRLFWKSRLQPSYRKRILERFGFFKAPRQTGGLWLHAVSVGETVAAIPIIRAFQKKFPELPITFTTTTPTGSERVKHYFKSEVFHVYCPYDLPCSVKRFLNKIQPSLTIILETELWPNLLHYCGQRKIPIIIANACLSRNSFEGYQKISPVLKPILSPITFVAAQTSVDCQRFISLGLDPNKVKMTGNVKYDIPLPENVFEMGKILREKIGQHRPIWIAASTHPTEEEKILSAHKTLRTVFPNALLILVPRHPNRFHSVFQLLKDKQENTITRSSGDVITSETTVFLGDTMGELLMFYAASDIAFVGGSLSPIGGHNILEAASLKLPVIVGPEIDNIREDCEKLQQVGALVRIEDESALTAQLIDWFNNPTLARKAGQNGFEVVRDNQGAVSRLMDMVQTFIH